MFDLMTNSYLLIHIYIFIYTYSSLTSALNTSNNEGLINQVITGNNGLQVISTMDPRLSALGLPQYPVLPSNTDPSKIEEIRRTIQVSNLDANVTGEDVLRFFNQIGEVKYVRLNSNDNIPVNLTKLKVALVEFTEQSSGELSLFSNEALQMMHCSVLFDLMTNSFTFLLRFHI